MESRAAGGEITLSEQPAIDAIRLQLDLFGHAVINSRNVRLQCA